MGTCWHCDKEVTLQEGQNKCDSCGEILFYHCWSCKNRIDIKEDMPTCKTCGYYYCPTCGICGERCAKNIWAIKIREIIPTITSEQLQQIISLIENIKVSNERKECINGVPITYAKGRIKGLLTKIDGFRVKNQDDREAFIKRVEELTTKELGFKTTISKIRENGSYGQEYRDAFNLLVCLGKMKITWIPATEDKPAYPLFERIDNPPCKYLSKEDLVINECPKCKTKYPRGVERCSNSKCPPYKKGKEKGQIRKNHERLNNIDTCQMYRGDFT